MRIGSLLIGLGLLFAVLSSSGCASLQSEIHLAPFYTVLGTAGGGTEVEALGGIYRFRRERPGGPYSQLAVRPLFIVDRMPTGETVSHFLTPLGTSKSSGGEYVWQLLPIARYERHFTPDGQLEWTFFSLPGIYWSRHADGRITRAWFPFGGVFEDFLSFDRLVFVMWPIWMKSERAGRITYHFLFPVFAYTYGHGGRCWRVWPLYGRNRYDGIWDRYFVLWPFFQWQHNDLSQPPERQEHKWMIWPLIGHATRGTFHSTTFIWPLFGWSRDPATGFWTLDFPWPFVELMHDPVHDVHRTRFWPLYSSYHGDGLDSTWFLWPIINIRHEIYPKAEQRTLYVIPFWQSWDRMDVEAGPSSFRKLWPLYQIERTEEHSVRTAFPALNPLWRTPEIDEMYAWIYELYTREKSHDVLRERTWLGIYRREKDVFEDRASIAGLWSRRRYRDGGERVTEVSLFFGLLRWRKRASDSLQWLPPALPGPGWPLQRSMDSGTGRAAG